MSVADLKAGDLILGYNGSPTSEEFHCQVLAHYAINGTSITYDGLTATHIKFKEHDGKPNVDEQGIVGTKRKEDVFSFQTTCQLVKRVPDEIGVTAPQEKSVPLAAFSSISTAFCPANISWDDFTSITDSIKTIVEETGPFWFNPEHYDGDWHSALSGICEEAIKCRKKSPTPCPDLEKKMCNFSKFLKDEYREKISESGLCLERNRLLQDSKTSARTSWTHLVQHKRGNPDV